jgi:hypothetical protein
MGVDNSTKQGLKKWSEQKKRQHSDFEATRTSIFIAEKKSGGKTFAKFIVLVLIIAGTLFADYCIISSQTSFSYTNLMQPFEVSGDGAQKVKDYLLYICSKIEKSGMKEVSGKWVRNIPPFFMKDANRKLGKMASMGYIVDEIDLDKDSIYHFKCHLIGEHSNVIIIDIAEQNIEGARIFRLLRVY